MASPNRSGHMAVGASYHPPPWTCPSCAPPARTYTCPSCAPPAPTPARAYGGYPPARGNPPARARVYGGYPPARGNPPARGRNPPARARAYGGYPPARGNPPARAYGGYGGYGGNQPARGYGGDVVAGLAIGAVGAAGIMSGDGWYPPVPAYGGYQNLPITTGFVATGIEELATAFSGDGFN